MVLVEAFPESSVSLLPQDSPEAKGWEEAFSPMTWQSLSYAALSSPLSAVHMLGQSLGLTLPSLQELHWV